MMHSFIFAKQGVFMAANSDETKAASGKLLITETMMRATLRSNGGIGDTAEVNVNKAE